MKLSKKEELLALGSALYLLGLEVEAHRTRVKEIAGQSENITASSELQEEVDAYQRAKSKFDQLEQRFLRLKNEI